MSKKNLKIEEENPLSLIEFMDTGTEETVSKAEEKPESPKDNARIIHWNSLMITAVLGVIFLLSIIQTIQTANIYNKLKTQSFGASNATSNSTQNLPSQVGGC